jgi:hypothetical protein
MDFAHSLRRGRGRWFESNRISITYALDLAWAHRVQPVIQPVNCQSAIRSEKVSARKHRILNWTSVETVGRF